MFKIFLLLKNVFNSDCLTDDKYINVIFSHFHVKNDEDKLCPNQSLSEILLCREKKFGFKDFYPGMISFNIFVIPNGYNFEDTVKNFLYSQTDSFKWDSFLIHSLGETQINSLNSLLCNYFKYEKQ